MSDISDKLSDYNNLLHHLKRLINDIETYKQNNENKLNLK